MIATEWWETEASADYLSRRRASLSQYHVGVSVRLVRPNYGGYRYEFYGD